MLLEVALLLSLDIFLGCFSKLSGGFLFRKPPQGLEHMARAVVDRSAAPSRKAFSIHKGKLRGLDHSASRPALTFYAVNVTSSLAN